MTVASRHTRLGARTPICMIPTIHASTLRTKILILTASENPYGNIKCVLLLLDCCPKTKTLDGVLLLVQDRSVAVQMGVNSMFR